MYLHPNLYTHPMDKAALKALKAIPAFDTLLQSWMKVWSEQQLRIENMATNLRVNEKQLPELYSLLPPICEKLGIEVPELYLTPGGTPKIYTYGDTKPFIVMTYGTAEKFSRELLSAVLAHECGHIACHHVLYSTMCKTLITASETALSFKGLQILTLPLQKALFWWMRCSDLSADRAAAICCGSSEPVVEYCMRFAGFPPKTKNHGNAEVFMEQAEEYLKMLDDSAWNKLLDSMLFSYNEQPLNAVRAHECDKWAKTADFQNTLRYISSDSTALALPDMLIPLPEGAKAYYKWDFEETQAALVSLGFSDVETVRETATDNRYKLGQTLSVTVDGAASATEASWHNVNAPVRIHYYQPLSESEERAAHPGQARMPDSSGSFIGKHFREAKTAFEDSGFTNIVLKEQKDSAKGWFTKDKEIIRVTAKAKENFAKGEWFNTDEEITILYRSYTN